MKTDGEQAPMKILLHVRSLHIGGSERQVVALAKSMTALGNEVHVVTIISGGPLERDLTDIPNVQLHSLGGSGLKGRLRYPFRLRSLIRSNRFDAVYGFLPTPNLGLLVARTVRRRPVIAWGVRSSGLDLSQYSGRVKWAIWLEKWLSRFADHIITNSQSALDEYTQDGYPRSELVHVPNAIDVDRFRSDPDARKSARDELGISDDTPLIGLFARLHPMKDHPTFLRAARILADNTPGVRFICAGGTSREYSGYERRTRASATEMGLDQHVLWLGPRTDPAKLMTACDITTLTSDSGEGFPNSVAESMACGVPCVVTDIGDAAAIVSDPAAVVSPANPEELAEAWQSALAQGPAGKARTAKEARQSIIDRYSPTQITRRTLDVLARR